MTTRAKFRVQEKTELVDGFRIELVAVTSGSPEDLAFFKYTPSGKVTMAVVQPDTAAQFKVGKNYYVDFTEAIEA